MATIYFTARQRFSPADGWRWIEYLDKLKLTQLRELVSLDMGLCPPFFEIDADDPDVWEHALMDGTTLMPFFTDLNYLLSYTYERQRFNLLASLYQPEEPCGRMEMPGFEFVGYDLLDEAFRTSAITNLNGFDPTLIPRSRNACGLLPNFDDALRTQEVLLRKAKKEFDLWGVWRHQIVGRGGIS